MCYVAEQAAEGIPTDGHEKWMSRGGIRCHNDIKQTEIHDDSQRTSPLRFSSLDRPSFVINSATILHPHPLTRCERIPDIPPQSILPHPFPSTPLFLHPPDLPTLEHYVIRCFLFSLHLGQVASSVHPILFSHHFPIPFPPLSACRSSSLLFSSSL